MFVHSCFDLCVQEEVGLTLEASLQKIQTMTEVGTCKLVTQHTQGIPAQVLETCCFHRVPAMNIDTFGTLIDLIVRYTFDGGKLIKNRAWVGQAISTCPATICLLTYTELPNVMTGMLLTQHHTTQHNISGGPIIQTTLWNC